MSTTIMTNTYGYNSDNLSKEKFFAHLHALYRSMNYADSDDPRKADWMPSKMAGQIGCQHIDKLLHDLVEHNVITEDELQQFHDEM